MPRKMKRDVSLGIGILVLCIALGQLNLQGMFLDPSSGATVSKDAQSRSGLPGVMSIFSNVEPSMNQTQDPIWDQAPSYFMVINGGSGVYVSSIYTQDTIFMKFTWTDLVKNDDGYRWTFDGQNWTENYLVEDSLSVFFPINNSVPGFTTVGCLSFCHGNAQVGDQSYANLSRIYFNQTGLGQNGDLWFWMAGLTNSHNFALDGYIDDQPVGTVGYHVDPEEDYGYIRNMPVNGNNYWYLMKPIFIQDPDKPQSLGPDFIKNNEAVHYDKTPNDPNTGDTTINPLTHKNWTKGDTVPGYLLNQPIGNGGDVRAKGVFSKAEQQWNLVLKRKLNTGHAHDIQFTDLGKEYPFGVARIGDLIGSVAPANGSRCTVTHYTGPAVLRFEPYLVSSLAKGTPKLDDPNGAPWSAGQHITVNVIDWVKMDVTLLHDDQNMFMRLQWTDPTNSTTDGLGLYWLLPKVVAPPYSYSLNMSYANGMYKTVDPSEQGDVWNWSNEGTGKVFALDDMHVGSTGTFPDTVGNNSQVQGFASYFGGKWTLTLSRPLETTSPEDVQFSDLTSIFVLRMVLYGDATQDGDNGRILSDNLRMRFDPDPKDTAAPDMVTGLTLTNGGAGNATLVWNPSAVSDFGQYTVYQSASQFSTVGGLHPIAHISSKTATRYEVDGLVNNVAYYFAVSAVDDNRNEQKAVTSVRVLVTDTVAPGQVAGLVVNAGQDSDASLSWSRSPAVDLAEYRVYTSGTSFTNTGSAVLAKTLDNPMATSVTIGGLPSGKQVFFAVTAVDLSGNELKTVSSKSATPDNTVAPPRIQGLNSFNILDPAGGVVGLTWSPSLVGDFSKYRVYVSKVQMDDVTGLSPRMNVTDINGTSVIITGLDEGTLYYFAVTAVDWNGNENKEVSTVTALPVASMPPPPVISFAAADAKDGKVLLNWTASTAPNFNHYTLYISDGPIASFNGSGVSVITNITSSSTTEYYVTNLTDGKVHYFAIGVANTYGFEDEHTIRQSQAMSTKTVSPKPSTTSVLLPYLIVLVVVVVLLVVVVFLTYRKRRYGSFRLRRPGNHKKVKSAKAVPKKNIGVSVDEEE